MGNVGTKIATTKKAQRPARKREAAPAPAKPRRRNRLSIVRSLIEKWAAELEKETATKTGVTELARLLALERELTASKQEQVREIRVTWVEPETTESKRST